MSRTVTGEVVLFLDSSIMDTEREGVTVILERAA